MKRKGGIPTIETMIDELEKLHLCISECQAEQASLRRNLEQQKKENKLLEQKQSTFQREQLILLQENKMLQQEKLNYIRENTNLKLQQKNNVLQLKNLYLQKELQDLRDHAPVEEACQYDTTAIPSPGDRVEILNPTIPSTLERRHIIDTDCVGEVDYIQGKWVFVTTDSGFQRYRFPSGLKVISKVRIDS